MLFASGNKQLVFFFKILIDYFKFPYFFFVVIAALVEILILWFKTTNLSLLFVQIGLKEIIFLLKVLVPSFEF